MNSSTSNSDSPKTSNSEGGELVGTNELKVVAFVLLVLLTVEFSIRATESRLSADLSTIRQFPQVAQSIADERAGGKGTVLILGNSISREGIDPNILQANPDWVTANYTCQKAVADGTAVTDWYYTFKRYFVRPGKMPDVIVLPYEGKNGGHFRDDRLVVPDRLGQFFCATADLPELLREDVTPFVDRADCLLSRSSLAFANRERIRKRCLDVVIPHYRHTAEWINDVQWDRAQSERDRNVGPQTFTRLERYNELAQRNNVQLILVAMPIAEPYELGQRFRNFLMNKQIPLIDGREVAGVTAKMIPDGLHMNTAGSELFSEFLAKRLIGRGGLIKSVESVR